MTTETISTEALIPGTNQPCGRPLSIPENVLRDKVFDIPLFIQQRWEQHGNLPIPNRNGTLWNYPLEDILEWIANMKAAAIENAA